MRAILCYLMLVPVLGCGSGESTKEDDSDKQITLDNQSSEKQSKGSQASSNQSNSPPNKNNKSMALPDDFPKDVPVSDEMNCVSVTKVKDNFMVTFHTKMEVKEIVDWFQAKLGEHDWESGGTPSISPTRALLAYQKQQRKCGISVTGFVLDESAQKDESTRGITVQTPAVK